ERSTALQTVLCAKGYVAPPRDGQHTLGASFNLEQTDPAPSEAEHRSNLEMLQEISPDLYQRLQDATGDTAGLVGRGALPLAGRALREYRPRLARHDHHAAVRRTAGRLDRWRATAATPRHRRGLSPQPLSAAQADPRQLSC